MTELATGGMTMIVAAFLTPKMMSKAEMTGRAAAADTSNGPARTTAAGKHSLPARKVLL